MCLPQVVGGAALLETKCDRNVAVPLENKSFRGEGRERERGCVGQTEIIRLLLLVETTDNLIKVKKRKETKIQRDNKFIKEDISIIWHKLSKCDARHKK